MRRAVLIALAACGSSPPPEPTPVRDRPAPAPVVTEISAAKKAELSAAQNAKLEEQSTAMAATCERPIGEQPRCTPSCYTMEPADSRGGKSLERGVAVIEHVVCERAGATDAARYVVADEFAAGKLSVRAHRGRIPKAGKRGSWQADVEAAAATALAPEITRGDVVRVRGGWKSLAHPLTRDKQRCVKVAHYARSLAKPLDACGSRGGTACEATGNASAHGINVVRHRLVEATRLRAAGKDAECQRAALEAIAVARGMPRWRQYMSLNTDDWKPVARYRTRYDGTLDEDALYALAIALGSEAQSLHAACGGAANPTTTAVDEQSFHTCW